MKESEEDCAKKLGIELDVFKKALERGKKILYEVRQNRPRPHMDDKFVTSWNGNFLTFFNLKFCIIFSRFTLKYRSIMIFLALNLCESYFFSTSKRP